MPAALRSLPFTVWLSLMAIAAIGPAWLMPPPRATNIVRAEVSLPELTHPEAVAEDGTYLPPPESISEPAITQAAEPSPNRSPAIADAAVRPASLSVPSPAIASARQPEPAASVSSQSRPRAAEPRTSRPPHVAATLHRLGQLSLAYWKQPDSRHAISHELDELSREVFFRPNLHVLAPYPVAPGQRLGNIARDHAVSWRYLERLNAITAANLPAGRSIKVMRGPFAAIVEKNRFRLTVHADGYVVAHYPIATGRDGCTPTGRFVVETKVENPTWYGRDRTVDADDPSNPLGERWLGLAATGQTPPVSGLGIHGTINVGSIGTAASNGCIRLHPRDIELLYDLLVPGSVVEIRE